jgi:hypothetical protein
MVMKTMNLKKFVDYMQEEGVCSFNIDGDKTIRPKCTLKHTKGNPGFLCGVHDWLYETYNIPSTLLESINQKATIGKVL